MCNCVCISYLYNLYNVYDFNVYNKLRYYFN